jgi:hypothetical protein
MRDGLEFYGQLLTVPDPRHKNAGSVVPFGNGQGGWNRTSLWAIAASETAQPLRRTIEAECENARKRQVPLGEL